MKIDMCGPSTHHHLCAIEISFGTIALILAFVTFALIRYAWRVRHDRNGYREARNVAVGLTLILGTVSFRSFGAWLLLWQTRSYTQSEIMTLLSPYVQIATIALIAVGAVVIMREFLNRWWISAIVISVAIPLLVAMLSF